MIVTILIVVGLILALVEEFRAKGTDLTAWAVIFVAIALVIERGNFL